MIVEILIGACLTLIALIIFYLGRISAWLEANQMIREKLRELKE